MLNLYSSLPSYHFFNTFFVQADVIEQLRLQHKKDLLKVVDIVLSHQVIMAFLFLNLLLAGIQVVLPKPYS